MNDPLFIYGVCMFLALVLAGLWPRRSKRVTVRLIEPNELRDND